MPQYFARQPNGKLARFSTIVDSFCTLNETQKDAIEWCIRQGMTTKEAKEKVRRAVDDEPISGEPRKCDEKLHRWYSSLETIMYICGTDALTNFLNEYREANEEKGTYLLDSSGD